MIGETLSHFKVTGKLGQGGMGVVYRGMDLNLDRPVAIKILPPESQRDEDSIARFLREAKTASKLQHPAITTIYEFGVKDDLRYLVMEFIEGKTLKEMLKKGSLPIRQLVEIATQVADALSLADEKGIIHRDIKSENIMLTDRGQVKILDFGLAKMVEKTGPTSRADFQTTAGLVMGTVSHMSPEQALGAELDSRTDIYSTGVVLFEMATGTLPFTGTSPNVVLAKILNQPPPSPLDFNPEMSPALEKVILKCLEKNREQRYQNALRLLVDLRAIRQEIESGRGWSGTVIMQPGKDMRLTPSGSESLGDLVPGTGAVAAAPTVGVPQQATAAAPPLTGPTGATVAIPPPGTDSGGIARPGSGAIAARSTLTPSARAWRLRACVTVTSFRRVFAVVAALYAMACIAYFALPLFRPERIQGLAVVRWLRLAIDPMLALVTSVISFELTYQNFNFLLIGLALITYILQQVVTGRLESLETWIRKPLQARPSPGGLPMATAAQTRGITASGAQQASRMSLLRDYAAAKRILTEVKKEMAFLSIDVVGSTKMKLGEDKIVIEHAFSEYKKFLERLFREFRTYKVAWTPDGVMTCFSSVEDAAAAARKLLSELDWFNRDVHQLQGRFHVRCGLNIGEVLLPDTKPLEEISDEVIDVAGHMQKFADVDSLWISGEAYQRLQDRDGFTRLDKQVDNRDVYAWRKTP